MPRSLPKLARYVVGHRPNLLHRALEFVGGDGELLVPACISFNRDGEILYVVDTYNFRIVAFRRRTGEYLFQWGRSGIHDGEFIHPFGMISGMDGFVYVTDDAANRVQKGPTRYHIRIERQSTPQPAPRPGFRSDVSERRLDRSPARQPSA